MPLLEEGASENQVGATEKLVTDKKPDWFNVEEELLIDFFIVKVALDAKAEVLTE